MKPNCSWCRLNDTWTSVWSSGAHHRPSRWKMVPASFLAVLFSYIWKRMEGLPNQFHYLLLQNSLTFIYWGFLSSLNAWNMQNQLEFTPCYSSLRVQCYEIPLGISKRLCLTWQNFCKTDNNILSVKSCLKRVLEVFNCIVFRLTPGHSRSLFLAGQEMETLLPDWSMPSNYMKIVFH